MLLKIDERCEIFSEELYKELYNVEKEKYLQTMSFYEDFDQFKKLMLSFAKENSKLTEENMYNEFLNFRDEQLNGLSLTDCLDNKIKDEISNLKDKLPKEILNKVKDIRVLALGYVSKGVDDDIKKFCEENKNAVEKTLVEYANYEKETFCDKKVDFLNGQWHDSFVVSAEKIGNDYVLNLNVGMDCNRKIVFKNCKSITGDKVNEGSWLYDELYIVDNGYEVHILLCDIDELKELIIECSEVIVE